MNRPLPHIGDSRNEEIIEEFLEGEPRAQVWRELRQALEGRLRDAITERDAAFADPGVSPKEREARVRELRAQVRALATEEAVTTFVEDSVRQTLNRPPRPRDFDAEFADEFDGEE